MPSQLCIGRSFYDSRRASFAKEPPFRILFRARFRAKARCTRRLAPGFRYGVPQNGRTEVSCFESRPQFLLRTSAANFTLSE